MIKYADFECQVGASEIDNAVMKKLELMDGKIKNLENTIIRGKEKNEALEKQIEKLKKQLTDSKSDFRILQNQHTSMEFQYQVFQEQNNDMKIKLSNSNEREKNQLDEIKKLIDKQNDFKYKAQ